MDVKDLFISVGKLHPAVKDAYIHAMATALVGKMRENMETMLPAFPFKNDKERQSAIEQALVAYEMGVMDGIEECIKHRMMSGVADGVEIDSSRSDGRCILSGNFARFNTGDKVKLIIIKQE